MIDDNTQDGAEPSPASAGSQDDPLSVCCHHLARSHAIIERKNAELERVRLTDEEREVISGAILEMDGIMQEFIPTPVEIRLRRQVSTLRNLLERTK